ncbi:MAG TPA: hypothetical protein PLC98_15855, partial [Anaerolineales bacterium]|nr:hypothetical protein [Anaerolineales bacterium]
KGEGRRAKGEGRRAKGEGRRLKNCSGIRSHPLIWIADHECQLTTDVVVAVDQVAVLVSLEIAKSKGEVEPDCSLGGFGVCVRQFGHEVPG